MTETATCNESKIRDALLRYVKRDAFLGEFRSWFVPLSLNIEASGESPAIELAHQIDGILAEASSGGWTEEELHEELSRPFVVSSYGQNVFGDPSPFPISQSQSQSQSSATNVCVAAETQERPFAKGDPIGSREPIWPADRLTPIQCNFRARIAMDAARYAKDFKNSYARHNYVDQEIFLERLTQAIEQYDTWRTRHIAELERRLDHAYAVMTPIYKMWPDSKDYSVSVGPSAGPIDL